jgi:hypothetical protein
MRYDDFRDFRFRQFLFTISCLPLALVSTLLSFIVYVYAHANVYATTSLAPHNFPSPASHNINFPAESTLISKCLLTLI